MNEIKKNLKIFALLTALLAGNVAFATEGNAWEQGERADQPKTVTTRTMRERIRELKDRVSTNARETVARARTAVADTTARASKAVADPITNLFRRTPVHRKALREEAIELQEPGSPSRSRRGSFLGNGEEAPEEMFRAVPTESKLEAQPEEPTTPKEPSAFSKTLSKITKTISDFVSQQVEMVNRFANRNSALHAAKALAETKASRSLNTNEETYFTDAMKKLSTKEKEEVANAYRVQLERIYRKETETLQKQIQETNAELKTPVGEKSDKIESLKIEIKKKAGLLNEELDIFRQYMQETLSPDEAIVTLASDKDPSFKSYEIINIRRSIDFTKPLADQMQTLFDNQKLSTHISYDGTKGRITPDKLMDIVSTWVADQLSLSSGTSVTHQLNNQILKITGKPWAQIDPSLQEAILAKLKKAVLRKYNSEEKAKKDEHFTQIETAGEMFKKAELERERTDVQQDLSKIGEELVRRVRGITILEYKPEQISTIPVTDIPNIDPSTIRQFSTEQIRALTKDQIKALTSEQIKALTSEQISILILKLPADQIKQLSPQQTSNVDAYDFYNNATSAQIKEFTPKIGTTRNINFLFELVNDRGSELRASFASALTPEQINQLDEETRIKVKNLLYISERIISTTPKPPRRNKKNSSLTQSTQQPQEPIAATTPIPVAKNLELSDLPTTSPNFNAAVPNTTPASLVQAAKGLEQTPIGQALSQIPLPKVNQKTLLKK